MHCRGCDCWGKRGEMKKIIIVSVIFYYYFNVEQRMLFFVMGFLDRMEVNNIR